jgi:hypothetical protein
LKHIREIRGLLERSVVQFELKPWSPYVAKMWEHQAMLLLQGAVSDVEVVVEGQEWKCRRAAGYNHTVSLPEGVTFLVCDCSHFRSTKIPCVDICKVLQVEQKQMFVIENLIPRWDVRKHPLYSEALRGMGLGATSTMAIDITEQPTPLSIQPAPLTRIGGLMIPTDEFDACVVPSRQQARHSELEAMFKQFVDIAKSDGVAFKNAKIGLAALTNHIVNTLPTGASSPAVVSSKYRNSLLR